MAMAETLARASLFRVPAAVSGCSSRSGCSSASLVRCLGGFGVSKAVALEGSRQQGPVVVHAAGDAAEVQVGAKLEEEEEGFLPSGEWPENFSILNFEDLSAHYEAILFKAEAQPSTFLADVMSKVLYTAKPEDLLEDIEPCFNEISGVPVVDSEMKCIGVLSKKDRKKASNGLKSKVREVMSSPAITLTANKTVSDAAVLMLKNKIHRIPIVNNKSEVVGIVTRTDIFTALDGGK